MKFSSKLLQNLACDILVNSNSMYNANFRDQKDGRLIFDKISFSWMQQFMAVHDIVLLTQRGRLVCSIEKERHIRKLIAFHLGILHKGFLSGDLMRT